MTKTNAEHLFVVKSVKQGLLNEMFLNSRKKHSNKKKLAASKERLALAPGSSIKNEQGNNDFLSLNTNIGHHPVCHFAGGEIYNGFHFGKAR